MRIAVTGPRGRLGSELVRRGCLPLEADVTDARELHQALTEAGPDVVIHCAALTDVDGCEHAPVRAAQVNTGGTFLLRQLFAGKIIYISTDYIFDGRNGPYQEDAAPNPIGIYGWSKLGGELALKNSNALIVRTTVLFDRHSQNFVTAVVKRLLSGEPVTAPSDLYGSPTYIPHLVEGLLRAIHLDLTGVINIAGSRVLSRFDFARLIAHRLEPAPKGFVAGRPSTGAACRPLKAGLRVEKAMLVGIPIYDPLEGLEEIINALETVEPR